MLNFFNSRPRIVIGVLGGIVTYALQPWSLRPIQHALLAWDAGMWLYLIMIWLEMVTADAHDVQRIAEREDENATKVLAILTTAAVLSIVAIVLELTSAKGHGALVPLSGLWHMHPSSKQKQVARFCLPTRPATDVRLRCPDR